MGDTVAHLAGADHSDILNFDAMFSSDRCEVPVLCFVFG
jgi:hypothetical protein